MAASVATPLERQFSTIPGLDSMTSSSTRGSTSVTLQFTLDRPLDAAAQDVQEAIAIVQRRLPSGMPTPPTLRKVNPADQPILNFSLNSPTLPLSVVDDYAETMISQRISMLNGVAQVNVFGAQKYAVRAQLDPNLLAARGIGIEDVETALAKHNVNLPTGTLWGPKQSFTVQASGQLDDRRGVPPPDRRLPQWRAGAPGTSSAASSTASKTTRWPAGSTIAAPSPWWCSASPAPTRWKWWTASATCCPRLREQMPPSVNLDIVYDRSESIRESVNDVKFTLLLTDRPGGAGHLPVPAQRLGHRHSQPGAAPRRSSAPSPPCTCWATRWTISR